jgi:hypothetical protein
MMFVMKAGGTRQRRSVMVVIKAGSLSAMPVMVGEEEKTHRCKVGEEEKPNRAQELGVASVAGWTWVGSAWAWVQA